MSIPGFTAEVSMYTSAELYQGAGVQPHGAPQTGVVPQQSPICHGNWCCDEWGNCIYKGRVLM